MAHTHEYDCIVCGAHFDDADALDRHNQQEHIRNAQGMEHPRESRERPDSGDRSENERQS